ncbi:hypothetical protein [Georgenia ruanii]|uniref:Uncharacterized protein n=1 Tax=Georgenia ruanii TaxID=348442 RepID=A0A7J9UUV4_9MICO|nr:hypothetical protein [Georgenia ruanii]MPV88388.1 hypothetical protein [Georgenia ruanii]
MALLWFTAAFIGAWMMLAAAGPYAACAAHPDVRPGIWGSIFLAAGVGVTCAALIAYLVAGDDEPPWDHSSLAVLATGMVLLATLASVMGLFFAALGPFDEPASESVGQFLTLSSATIPAVAALVTLALLKRTTQTATTPGRAALTSAGIFILTLIVLTACIASTTLNRCS